MFTLTDIADQQDRALARLLELGLAAAEKVQARLMAAEDDAAVGELALALNRASRNVRQTIALQMKAARDRRLEGQEAAAEARRAREAVTLERRVQLKTAVERIIWDECEGDDFEVEELIDRLDQRIDQESRGDGFTAEPLEVHIDRLCAELGVSVPPHLGEVSPKATEGASAEDSRSSVRSLRDGSPEGGATGWRSSA